MLRGILKIICEIVIVGTSGRWFEKARVILKNSIDPIENILK